MDARRPFDPTLYLVLGGDALGGRSPLEVAAAAVRGGVTLVQLREKMPPDAEVIALARAMMTVLAPAGVPLILNDRVAAAREVGAAGVHLGQEDLDAGRARAILGAAAVIGVSAGNAEEAARLDPSAADYVGIGSVYPTASKPDAGPPIGLAGLKAVRALVPLPAVAIGGIDAGNAAEVAATGVAGIAVVSAICAAADPEAAARALRRAIAAGRRRPVG